MSAPMTLEHWAEHRAAVAVDPVREAKLRRVAMRAGVIPRPINATIQPIGQARNSQTPQRAQVNSGSNDGKKSCCKPSGPGTELKKLLTELGIKSQLCEGCTGFAKWMDSVGVDGCRKERAKIVERLAKQKESSTWLTQATVATRLFTTGLILSIDPRDPLGSLVDIAISRAEAKLTTECPCEPATAEK